MVKIYDYCVLGEDISFLSGKEVIIWGISVSGLEELVRLKSVGAIIRGFTDSFVTQKGVIFASFPVLTFDEIKSENICIVISTRNTSYLRSILIKCEKLENAKIYAYRFIYGPGYYDTLSMKEKIDIDREKISYVQSNLYDKKSIETFNCLLQYRITNNPDLIERVFEKKHRQYFPENDILKKSKDEIFVDAGAYNGDTSVKFAEWVDYNYEKIFLMEPDPLMFEVLKEYVKLKNLTNIELINKGAYCCNSTVSFCNDPFDGSSRIDYNSISQIAVTTIDDMLGGERASYIKMDIEGVEYEALLGCAQTIKCYRPKLAISIYHKDDDLWTIPYYMMKEYPFYKYFIRHYTDITTETIMYATV